MNTFLWGSKWADGIIATAEHAHDLIEMIEGPRNNWWSFPLTQEQCGIVESSINYFALTLLRYSASQWGNDYYGAFDSICAIKQWISKQK